LRTTHHEAAGDPLLLPSYNVIIALAARRRANVGHVRACGGLGDHEAALLAALNHVLEHHVLDALRAVLDDGRQRHRVDRQLPEHAAATSARQLVPQHDFVKSVKVLGLGAAVLDGEEQTTKPSLIGLDVQLLWVALALFDPAVLKGLDLFFHKVANLVT